MTERGHYTTDATHETPTDIGAAAFPPNALSPQVADGTPVGGVVLLDTGRNPYPTMLAPTPAPASDAAISSTQSEG
jgi:hypothetical protein